VVIVITGVIELFLEISGNENSGASISVIRVLRVFRLVRLVRIIRYPFFRELRMMVDSVLGCVKSFTWCALVLGMFFYICGISLTSGTCEYISGEKRYAFDDEDAVLLQEYFGRLDRTMMSLYQSMSGGKDWGDIYAVLHPLPPTYQYLFVAFTSFALFAVVNVVTGIFVESAIKTSAHDCEVIIQEEMGKSEAYKQTVLGIFEEMDTDGSGVISLEQFEKHLDDERVVAYFQSLKLDVRDARSLFSLLDTDGSGTVEVQEFMDGCQRLKGESRNQDIHLMRHELKQLNNRFSIMEELVTSLGHGGSKRKESIKVVQAVLTPPCTSSCAPPAVPPRAPPAPELDNHCMPCVPSNVVTPAESRASLQSEEPTD